jgi:hypothetical protein
VIHKTILGSFFLLLVAALSASAGEGLPPIKEVSAKPKANVFKTATRKKPIVLKSEDDAAKYFGDAELAKLKKAVDFEKQFALVFAWRGSGQDKLNTAILESFPEQIVFSIRRGRTRDLRPHVHVFALRANVRWSVK